MHGPYTLCGDTESISAALNVTLKEALTAEEPLGQMKTDTEPCPFQTRAASNRVAESASPPA